MRKGRLNLFPTALSPTWGGADLSEGGAPEILGGCGCITTLKLNILELFVTVRFFFILFRIWLSISSSDRDFGNRTLIRLKINFNINYPHSTILPITTISTFSLGMSVNPIRYRVTKINANKLT